jgi:hypothetical protein
MGDLIFKPNFHAIIASDSRCKKFPATNHPNEQLYSTHIIAKSGAKINDLEEPIFHKLLQFRGENDVCILHICGGINELTIREKHTWGTELVPNPNQALFLNICDLKTKVRSYFPNTLVAIATIPIISFQYSKIYYKQTGRLLLSKYTEEETKQHQQSLSDTLAEINTCINHENRKNQLIPKIGDCTPSPLYMHQHIEKTCRKRLKDGNSRIIKRIPTNALVDGVHATDTIIQKWYQENHRNLIKECAILTDPSLYKHKCLH